MGKERHYKTIPINFTLEHGPRASYSFASVQSAVIQFILFIYLETFSHYMALIGPEFSIEILVAVN